MQTISLSLASILLLVYNQDGQLGACPNHSTKILSREKTPTGSEMFLAGYVCLTGFQSQSEVLVKPHIQREKSFEVQGKMSRRGKMWQ